MCGVSSDTVYRSAASRAEACAACDARRREGRDCRCAVRNGVAKGDCDDAVGVYWGGGDEGGEE